MSYSSTVLADSPVSYWRLGEPSGTIAVDERGVNNGTYVNGPTLGAVGAIADGNTAATFAAGSSQRVSASAGTTATDNVTIEFWVKLASLTSQTTCLVANSSNNNSGYGVYITDSGGQATGGLTLNGILPGVTFQQTNYTFADLNFHHVVYTRDAGTWKIYVDSAAVSVLVGATNAPLANPIADFSVAARSGTGFVDYFSGTIDEVAVYSTVLSPAQVAAHYNAASVVDIPVSVPVFLPRSRGPKAVGPTFFAARQAANPPAVSTANNYAQPLAAVLSFTGSMTKRTGRGLAAVLSFAGATANRTGKALAGVVSFTGAQARQGLKSLAAAATFTGSTARAVVRPLAATASFTGGISKRTVRAVGGGLGFAGVLTIGKLFARSLAASLSFAGAATRTAGKGLTGGLSFVGSIPSRAIVAALAGGLSFAGGVSKRASRILTASVGFVGNVARLTRRALAGVVTFTGSTSRQAGRGLFAAVAFSGATVRFTARGLAATVTASGVVARRVGRSLTASVGPAGTLGKAVRRGLSAALSFAGAVAGFFQHGNAPSPLLPTTNVLGAHVTNLSLDAHTIGVALTAHTSTAVPAAHAGSAPPNAHVTDVSVDAHQRNISVDDHQTNLTLND